MTEFFHIHIMSIWGWWLLCQGVGGANEMVNCVEISLSFSFFIEKKCLFFMMPMHNHGEVTKCKNLQEPSGGEDRSSKFIVLFFYLFF